MYVKTIQWNIDFLNPWFFECFDNPNQILHRDVARIFSEVRTTHQMPLSPDPTPTPPANNVPKGKVTVSLRIFTEMTALSNLKNCLSPFLNSLNNCL